MITASQLWDNFFLIVIVAIVIDTGITALFSVKLIEDLMENTISRSVKSLLILLLAFGICYKMPELRLFYNSKVKLPDTVHMVLTALFTARMAALAHDFFMHVRRRAMQ